MNVNTNSEDHLIPPSSSIRSFIQTKKQDLIKQKFKQFESLDYDVHDNLLYEEFVKKQTKKDERVEHLSRWFAAILVGLITSLIAFSLIYLISKLTENKFLLLQLVISHSSRSFALSFISLVLFNFVFALPALALSVYVEPCCSGSGLPDLISFLNGVKIIKFTRFKTLVCKFLANVLIISGGLPVGPEGPLVQMGGIVGAGVPQAKSPTFHFELPFANTFRNDHDKLDFTSCGAAAGIAAAFGSPIGGTIFVMEEGLSFWNPYLISRIFVSAMTATFFFNFLLTGTKTESWGKNFNSPGILSLGFFENQIPWKMTNVPLFILLAAIGGLMGALYNAINKRLLSFRAKHIQTPIRKLSETLIVLFLFTALSFSLSWYFHTCISTADGTEEVSETRRLNCPKGHFNDLGTLFFGTSEASVKQLLHNPSKFGTGKVAAFFAIYFTFSSLSIGLSTVGGLFIPCIAAGSSLGVLYGIVVKQIFPSVDLDLGSFGLIGAVSLLTGVTRMTLSLAAIIIESTNDLSFTIPIILSLLVSKWVADTINHGFYHTVIKFKKIPHLESEPEEHMKFYRASDVMSHDVICFPTNPQVNEVYQKLKGSSHHSFPVVNEGTQTLLGVIPRYYLVLLLQKKNFGHNQIMEDYLEFEKPYPRYPDVESITLNQHDLNQYIDLSKYMGNCHFMEQNTSLYRVYFLFRQLGLRHLVIVDRFNSVVGIVTRKDLAYCLKIIRSKSHQPFHQSRIDSFMSGDSSRRDRSASMGEGGIERRKGQDGADFLWLNEESEIIRRKVVAGKIISPKQLLKLRDPVDPQDPDDLWGNTRTNRNRKYQERNGIDYEQDPEQDQDPDKNSKEDSKKSRSDEENQDEDERSLLIRNDK